MLSRSRTSLRITLACIVWAVTTVVAPIRGEAPALLPAHFPDALHAVVWRNWMLVPMPKLAATLGGSPADILKLGKSMGLPDPPVIDAERVRRSYITVIRRNWHLLPNEQLRALLGWDDAQFRFVLREDDFLEVKLGPKPKLDPVRWRPPIRSKGDRIARIKQIVEMEFPAGLAERGEPPFGFVRRLSMPPPNERPAAQRGGWSPRFCYSYFALYGDPLLEVDLDPFPEGLLARLAEAGADGVWLQGVLYKLAPFPWKPELSEGWQTRLANLKALVERARRYNIGVYLYLNEPRTMPVEFFVERPELRGVVQGGFATLCTSQPQVREYLAGSVETVCRAAPDLAGIFTITASENLTNCWSHHRGQDCPNCRKRTAGAVIGEVNAALKSGIDRAGARAKFIAWDWGWQNDAVAETIAHLPKGSYLSSVSEWDQPIVRGGIANRIGEYCLTTHGPGPRARRHWQLAKDAGLKTLAKIQANCTWELASLPWLPVESVVARHAAALRDAQVDGIMLGWTLGGHPSPNLEIVAEMSADRSLTAEGAQRKVATRRYGARVVNDVVAAWAECAKGMAEFPYDGGTVYSGPQNVGPANLLWLKPTGMKATMVCYPFDDLTSWRAIYPEAVFVAQFEKTAAGFEHGAGLLNAAAAKLAAGPEREALAEEAALAEAAGIHFRSAALQSKFVAVRNRFAAGGPSAAELANIARAEIRLAKRLYELQTNDSRIGFEATNHYFYTPLDLVEKVVNCRAIAEGLSSR